LPVIQSGDIGSRVVAKFSVGNLDFLPLMADFLNNKLADGVPKLNFKNTWKDSRFSYGVFTAVLLLMNIISLLPAWRRVRALFSDKVHDRGWCGALCTHFGVGYGYFRDWGIF